MLQPFVGGMMPDLAPWLPLLAIPFDAEVEPTPEASALDPAASRDKLHWALEAFLERILMMPTLLVVEDGTGSTTPRGSSSPTSSRSPRCAPGSSA